MEQKEGQGAGDQGETGGWMKVIKLGVLIGGLVLAWFVMEKLLGEM